MRTVIIAAACLALAGCQKGPAVDITVQADTSVDAALVAQVRTLEFAVSGSEEAHITRALSRPMGSQERIVYSPHATGGSIIISVTARDGSGKVLLSGSGSVALSAGVVSTRVALFTAGLMVDEAAHDFGDALLGTTTSTANLTVTNGGDRATGPLTIMLGGDNSDAFLLADGCNQQSLQPGGSCTLAINFHPSSVGAASATLSMDALPGGSATVALSGNGLDPGVLSMAPTIRDFGMTGSGQTSSDLSFVVTNSGGSASGALTTSLGGANAGDFAFGDDGCRGKMVAAGGSCTVAVHFAPGSTGVKAATLTVSGMPGGNAIATLSGTGVPPASIGFSPTPFDFNTVDANGTSSPQTFTLTNNGAVGTGTVGTSITGDTSQFTVVSNSCSSATLAPGATCTIVVKFTPSSYGSAGLNLAASASPGGSTSATLTGTGRVYNTLSVSIAGNGSGTVAAPGLTCAGNSCSGQYARIGAAAPTVALTGTAATGATLTWSGGCSGSTSPCNVTVDAPKTVTATFSLLQYMLSVTNKFVAGASGGVTSNVGGINCGPTCSATYNYGAPVVLSAAPSAGFLFQGWAGDCSGSSTTCSVSINGLRNVTAIFRPKLNYAFTSSTAYAPGSLGGLVGADNACQARANAAGLGGKYIALLSSSTVNANSRIASARGWMRTDGLPFADSATTLFNDLIVDYPLILDEFGQTLDMVYGITGSYAGGGYATGMTCADWTQTTGTASVGPIYSGGGQWFTVYGASCGSAVSHLYCVETDYSTPLSITPVSGATVFVSKAIFHPETGVAAADTLCTSEATSAGLNSPTTYKAVLNTTTASAKSRFKPQNGSVPVVRPDGIVVNATETDFFNGVLSSAAPSMCADKTFPYGTNNVATGATSGALTMPGTNDTTCTNWTSNANAVHVGGGDDDWLTSFSRGTISWSCDTTYLHVYCLQDF